MSVAINGSGTITGISVGGIPDGVVDTDVLAANAVTFGKIGTTEQGQLCKAWVNFNGTVAIRASYNVSSITDNGAGDYTVNFTTAMVDANYQVCTDCQLQLSAANFSDTSQPLSYATTQVRVACGYYLEAGTNNYRDQSYVHVAIFR